MKTLQEHKDTRLAEMQADAAANGFEVKMTPQLEAIFAAEHAVISNPALTATDPYNADTFAEAIKPFTGAVPPRTCNSQKR